MCADDALLLTEGFLCIHLIVNTNCEYFARTGDTHHIICRYLAPQEKKHFGQADLAYLFQCKSKAISGDSSPYKCLDAIPSL